MTSLARYLHTIRYLRTQQIAGRVWMRLHRARPKLGVAPGLRPMTGKYTAPVTPPVSLLAEDVFRFLSVERRCSDVSDWHPAGMAKLWIYNLHYFDDLNADNSASRVDWHRKLMDRWVGQNPPGKGDGWEPYPVSRRIVNWVKWAARGNTLSAQCCRSLAVQARWLTDRLEYHLLGNHLLANGKAMIHAGLCFDGVEAERWYQRGIAIVERQIREQVLPDGGHFELSTMYHAAVLEDLLDLVNLHCAYNREPPTDWIESIERMQHWLQVMSHPDGDIAFFNDAAFGVTPTSAALVAYAIRLGLPPTKIMQEAISVLAASGYVRCATGPVYLVCDCGAVGPDHLPGHAHADTLSFELSLAGQRVFVNSGTSLYGDDAERQRQRSTAAHNTVVVDGHDSSEVWAGFRVARRARARLQAATSTLPAIVTASHDGYRRLPGRNEHSRQWTVDRQFLRIDDTISGQFRVADAYFYLHPKIEARLLDSRDVLLAWESGLSVRVAFDGASDVTVQSSTWHPRFGVTVANQCIRARISGPSLVTRVYWAEDR